MMQSGKEIGRLGFGRLDMAAVGTCVTLLIGLAGPALLFAKDRSNVERSAENLMRIGEAFAAHREVYGFFPSNGGPAGETVDTPDARTFIPGDAGSPYRWGYGDPQRAGRQQPGSWAYALLPYMGHEKAFLEQDQAVAVREYYLPGRRPAVAEVVPSDGKDPVYKDWKYITAGLNPWGKTDYAANDQVVRGGVGSVMRADEIGDGLANTVIAAEKAMDSRVIGKGGWYWDEPIVLGGSGGTGRKGKKLFRDGPILEDAADNWGSPDASGVRFLFADGRVQTLNYNIDAEVMWSFITPNDGDEIAVAAPRRKKN
jgi:hypothetical protein